ncbi:MAG TPA: hypothetical protein VLC92_01150 [Rhodocyclaceae bacterium]|nr:hypothetical protein [Rhodocyclaceae bacterium]
MSDNEARIEINGDAAGLEAAVKRGAAAFSQLEEHTKARFAGIGSVVEGLQSKFLAFTAVIGGGAMFGKIVEQTAQLTEETQNLARALGISVTEAGAYKASFDDIGVSSEEFQGAAQKLAKNLKDNEQSLNKMGLATRDASGHLRPLNQMTVEAIGLVNGYKEGTDRVVAGQIAFGKGFEMTSNLAKLNTETIQQNLDAQRELGSIVGEESVANFKAYDDATDQTHRVMHAMTVTVGNALMPVLTDLANWFNSIGPVAVTIIKGALGGLAATFHLITTGVTVLWETLNAMIVTVAEPIRALAAAIGKAVTGDFAGAASEIKGIGATIGGAWSGAFDQMLIKAQSTRDRLTALFGNPTEGVAPAGGGKSAGGLTTPAQKGPDEASDMSKWQAELSAAKVAYQEQHNLREMSRQEEIAFWQNVLATRIVTEKDSVAIARQTSQLRLGILKEAFATEVEDLRSQQNAYKSNTDAKLSLAEQEAALMRQRYGVDSREYAASQGQIVQIKKQAADQMRAVEETIHASRRDMQLAEIEDGIAKAQFELDMGLATREQVLAQEREFESQRYQIELQAMEEKLALAELDPDKNVVLLEQLNAQKLAIQRQHNQALVHIDQDLALERTESLRETSNDMANAFGGMLTRMANRQQTFAQSFRQSMAQMYDAFLQNMVIKPMAQWLAMVMKQLAVKLGIMSAETAAQTAQSATTMTTKATEATAVVGANAAEAASGAAASASSIPYVGWILAGVAFAAVLAMTLGAKSSIKSAENGYDIPAGINPMMQLHEEEMVLPKEHANTIRNLANGGGEGGGSAQSGGTVNVYPRGKMTRREADESARHIADALNKLKGGGWSPA